MYSKSVHEQAFFAGVAADMFRNVSELYEQIDAQFTGRSVNENVGAQITAFCVYVCGLFSTYACRYPNRKLPFSFRLHRKVWAQADPERSLPRQSYR